MALTVAMWCGSDLVEVDRSIAEMALPRVHVPAFTAPPGADATRRLSVQRVVGLDGQVVEGPLGRCTVRLEGSRLLVEVGDGPFLGELVLRLAYYLVTTRQGGLLVHSSAVAEGERGLIACGKSGAGKSTLARLGREAGLRLLTDEVVQIFPDGRLGGTPFRSDADNVGSPGLARARYFVALQHAPREALEGLSALEAAGLIMGQCFEVEAVAIPRVEVQRRALAFLSRVEIGVLCFRKDPAAGVFVRGVLSAQRSGDEDARGGGGVGSQPE